MLLGKSFFKTNIIYRTLMNTFETGILQFNRNDSGTDDENNPGYPSSLYEANSFKFASPLIALAVTSSNPLNNPLSGNENKASFKYDWTDKKILIVEDDDANFLFLNYLLKKSNAAVLHATDGIQAVKICREINDINIILMDVQLPMMDGYDATIEIRNFRKKLPIIAQTAYAQQSDKNKCMEAGCNEYVNKPIDKDYLLELINKYIQE